MKNSITILLDKCFECGTIGDVDFHHVVPKSKGGTQMIPLCLLCHSKVHGEHMLKIRKLAGDAHRKKVKEYKEKGIPHNFGRKKGSKESIENFMDKQVTKDIIYLLSFEGNTIRKIAKMANCATNTVLKVKKLLNKQESLK